MRANPESYETYEGVPPEPQGVPGAMEDMESDNTKGHWDKRLTSFQKLMFIKVFKTEKTVFAVTEFLRDNLGQKFVESPRLASRPCTTT